MFWTEGDAGFNPENSTRNSNAFYFLPTTDEWYKAAYYDPETDSYFDYPTGSDTPPVAVAEGTDAGTAVYNQPESVGPAEITQAGGESPYGTMGQGGNVVEMTETATNNPGNGAEALRAWRGGAWFNNATSLSSTTGGAAGNTELGHDSIGFRVASVPEPSSVLLFGSAVLVLIARGRRGQSRA